MAAKPLAELFERQARRWAIERRAGMPAPRGAVVSISRQPWAGGDEVAERVAGWLDYGLFGLDHLRELARDPSLRDRLVADLEPAARTAIEERARLLFGELDEAEVREVASVVAALGERGMAVVVGRGAIAVLPRERTLRVLVVAPRETRAERLAAALDLPPVAANARLEREDRERLAFLRDRLGLASDDAALYDLVVNTERLAPDAAAALVVEAVRRRFPPPPAGPAGSA
ncbi:MAG TPA: cytidylate kinase-like family protein [Myxococcota bacterium]|nr:cytidylate kinase-like family protein [Myxococcota bacterium]